MSLYGALFAGVSGLSAESSAMAAISDNVTNVNTTGYKGTKVNFQTLITKQAASTKYSAGGVQSKPRQNVDLQGLLQSSSSATDVGISGNGFFAVNSNPNGGTGEGTPAFTRAGSFKVDKTGYMQNVGGWYMQGWPLQPSSAGTTGAFQADGTNYYIRQYNDSNGVPHTVNQNTLTDLKPLNLNEIGGTANATSSVRMGANLPSDDAVASTHTTSVLSYDSLGNPSTINYGWTKMGTNSWDLQAIPPDTATSAVILDANGAVYSSMGRLDIEAVPTVPTSFTISVGGNLTTVSFTAAATTAAVPLNGAVGTVAAYNVSCGAAATASTVATDIKAVIANAIAVNNYNDLVVNGYGAAAALALVTANVAAGNYANTPSGSNSVVFTQMHTQAITVNFATATPPLTAAGAFVFSQQKKTQILAGVITPVTSFNVSGLASENTAALPNISSAISFNGNGTPNTITPKYLELSWANGALDQTGAGAVLGASTGRMDIFLGNANLADGMTQFGGPFQINYVNQNGSAFGNFTSLSIGGDGIVTALFDNGVNRPIFQIPLATFANPNGMEALTGNVWIETSGSGMNTLRTAGSSGAGSVNGGSLEASTVDLGEEFSNMIITQRAYSAAAKIITTADQMLDELVQIKR